MFQTLQWLYQTYHVLCVSSREITIIAGSSVIPPKILEYIIRYGVSPLNFIFNEAFQATEHNNSMKISKLNEEYIILWN